MRTGNSGSRRRVLIVAAPEPADRDGQGVEEGTWVLVDGALGGDIDAAPDGDHGEPVADLLGGPDNTVGHRSPQTWGDTDAAPGDNHGEPVADLHGGPDSGVAHRSPQAGGGTDSADGDEASFADLGEWE